MTTKIIKSTLAVVGCVVALAVGVYVLRDSLLRAGINIFFDEDIAVTHLQGLQLGASHARIDNLEVRLTSAGQHLTIADIELDFSLQGLFKAPIVESLVIGSARLASFPENDEGEQAGPATAANRDNDAVNNQPAPVLLAGELLQQLRNFPLKKIALSDIELPQLRQKLALNLDQQTDGLQLHLASGRLQVRGSFTQPNADAAAQFGLVLQANDTTVAEVELLLQPQAAGYAITGNGTLDFSDANTPFAEYLTTPLPVSAVDFKWTVAADATADLLQVPAGNIDVAVLPGSTFMLRPGLVPDLGELAVNIPERAQLSLAPGAAMKVVDGRIPLSLAGTWQQQALQGEVILTPGDCQLGDILECSIGFDSTASLAAYTITSAEPAAAINIDAIEFAGSGNVNVSGDLVAFKLDAGARFGSGAITGPAYSLASVNITSESVLDANGSLAGSQLTIAADNISLALAELKAGEYQTSPAFSLLDIKLEAAEKLAGTLTLHTPELAVSGPLWLPTIGFDADMSIDGDELAFSTPLLLPGAPSDAQLQANGSYDFAAGTGQVKIKLPPLALTGPGNSLSSYLRGWPYPADVMTGTLALDVDVQLSPDLTAVAASAPATSGSVITGSTNIVVTDVAGFYAENFFRGLTTTIDAAYDSSTAGLPVTTPPLNLTLAELNVGMAITDIVLDYQLDAASQIANIRSISGRVLDGAVSGMDIEYDFSKERNEMTFMFAGLRLERMLELAEYEGVEAVGAVSGEVPITITGSQVQVNAGRLYAEEPGGSIRYLSAPPAGQGNPAMDLVNQALSNYQFQSLESTIDYTPEGELLLGMQLRGHNPDMNGGQAINLNLNISDNIPQLLKSLQAGRAIEDFLQEQYQ